ncbi:hypothetical protein niasHS_015660 [Heterodera schachtii]|uniref:Uncharacterized protein n=1 Tax=Heterodera schachtii TaxID=97005 RepID=A0ABD2HU98_HETSC
MPTKTTGRTLSTRRRAFAWAWTPKLPSPIPTTTAVIVVNFNDVPELKKGPFYYPKKVVSLVRGRDCLYIVLDRGSNQLFNRLQLFKNNGEYVCRLVPPSPCPIDQVTVMSVNKENEQLVIIDNKNVVHAFEFELFSQLRLTRHFSISGYVHEASDIAVFKGQYYITDYKTHCVVIYSLEGKQMGKFGGLNITPYPVGIDFSKTGDILVGDSHGNPLPHLWCSAVRASRSSTTVATCKRFRVALV